MHRFFLLDTHLHLNQTVDLSILANQLINVLRISVGTEIILLDNSGDEFFTQINQLDRKQARGYIFDQRRCLAEPTHHLTLYQCSLKAEKFEWVLQKTTELGVSRIVPVISERSIVRPVTALLPKYPRWQSVLREAAEQCGRGRIPELVEPLEWVQAMRHAQGVKLLAWEETSKEENLSGLESKRLGDWIQQHNPLRSQSLNLLIGPEGGISPNEAAQAISVGWQCLSLGRRILRAETAAVAGVALLMQEADHAGVE